MTLLRNVEYEAMWRKDTGNMSIGTSITIIDGKVVVTGYRGEDPRYYDY